MKPHEQDQYIRQFFDERSDLWRDLYAGADLLSIFLIKRQQWVLELAREHLAGSDGVVLDVGCGAGLVPIALARDGYHVHAADVAPNMIAEARRLAADVSMAGQLELLVADIRHLPCPDATFAVIICMGVLEYLPEEGPALEEMIRVLAPGGLLIVTVPNRWSLTNLFNLPRSLPAMTSPRLKVMAARTLARLTGRGTSRNLYLGRGFSLSALRRDLLGRGLRDVRVMTHGSGPLWPLGLPIRPSRCYVGYCKWFDQRNDRWPYRHLGNSAILTAIRPPGPRR